MRRVVRITIRGVGEYITPSNEWRIGTRYHGTILHVQVVQSTVYIQHHSSPSASARQESCRAGGGRSLIPPLQVRSDRMIPARCALGRARIRTLRPRFRCFRSAASLLDSGARAHMIMHPEPAPLDRPADDSESSPGGASHRPRRRSAVRQLGYSTSSRSTDYGDGSSLEPGVNPTSIGPGRTGR